MFLFFVRVTGRCDRSYSFGVRGLVFGVCYCSCYVCCSCYLLVLLFLFVVLVVVIVLVTGMRICPLFLLLLCVIGLCSCYC